MRLAPLVVLLASAAAADPYEQAKATYAWLIARPPLGRRFQGIRTLAGTRDPRALQVLAARYGKAKDPERYLVAWALGRWFADGAHDDALWALGARHGKPSDGYLRFATLLGAAGREEAQRILDLCRDDGAPAFARAAALEALAACGHPRGLETAAAVLDGKLPSKEPLRAVIVESCASLLVGARERPLFREACERVIRQLEDKKTLDRTRLVLARRLARAFGVDRVVLDGWFWRSLLEIGRVPDREGHTRSHEPAFGGLRGAGRRIAFLLDLSDSMLDPLTPEDRADAGDPLQPVESRFDLARAYLEESLRALPADAVFAVIGFGSEAFPFAATPALVEATPENVQAALAAVRKVPVLPGHGKDRPYGTLKGDTNLHGALLLAFRLTSKGLLERHEHCDPKALLDGCDTIFLLSDGKPTRDDFAEIDEYSGDRFRTDAETGATAKMRSPGFALYPGPYQEEAAIRADVERLNLFRKAEIHCIAMGEAEGDLLRKLAELGLGRFRAIGTAK